MVEFAKGTNLRAAIIGGTGACGRELIRAMIEHPKVGKVIVLTRRKLDEWALMPAEKIQIIELKSLDNLDSFDKGIFAGCDVFFCCVGGRVKMGKEEFRKVDYHYPCDFGELAHICGVPHYSIITSKGASKKAWTLYFKTKGEVEQTLIDSKFKYLSILRPGMITARENDKRFTDKLAKVVKAIPLVANATAKRVADVQLMDALAYHLKMKDLSPEKGILKIYENKEIKNIKFDQDLII